MFVDDERTSLIMGFCGPKLPRQMMHCFQYRNRQYLRALKYTAALINKTRRDMPNKSLTRSKVTTVDNPIPQFLISLLQVIVHDNLIMRARLRRIFQFIFSLGKAFLTQS